MKPQLRWIRIKQGTLAFRASVAMASLLAIFGVVILIAFSVISSRQIRIAINSDSKLAQDSLAKLVDARKAKLLGTVRYAGKSTPRVRMLVFAADPATVQEEAGPIQSEFSADGVTLLDSTGKLLGESGFNHLTSSLGDPTQAPDARSNRNPWWTPFVSKGQEGSTLLTRDHHLYLGAIEPIADSEGVKGFIALYSRFGDAEAEELSNQAGANAAFLLNGEVVGSSIPGFNPPTKISTGQVVGIKIAGKSYSMTFQLFPGSSPNQNALIATLMDETIITAPYRQASIVFVIILGVGLIATFTVGSWLGHRTTTPILLLSEHVEAMQRGQWPEPLAENRKDEIGTLQTGFNRMVLALKDSQSRLLSMIDHDPLTGALNHRFFKERISEEIARYAATEPEYRLPLSIAILDLDRFAAFNDEFGHDEGDAALAAVTLAFKTTGGPAAIFGRYGGDSFALCLPTSSADALHQLILETGQKLPEGVQLSAGIVELTSSGEKITGLLIAAELALKQAKLLGRNQVCRFEGTVDENDASPANLNDFENDPNIATIQALAAAVDAKDAYTKGHSTRVAQYSADLARHLGESLSLIDLIFKSGTLHDVGKIGIPDAILKKPSRLEPEEQAVMETHPILGEMIVAKVPQLKELLPGVRHHHERFDGKGYPDKLVGDQIPYMARIMAVADTYDAMTSDRPYRKGLKVSIALAEISKGAGTQFDPVIAHAFVELMQPFLEDESRSESSGESLPEAA